MIPRNLRTPLAIAALIAAAVLVRIVAWWLTAPVHPTADMAGYLRLGQRILDTGELGTVFRPPGYPMFLAVLQALTGGAPLYIEGVPISLRLGVAHATLGGLTTWWVLRLLPTASASTRLTAGALAAFYPPLVAYTTTVLSEVLAVSIVSAGLYGLYRAHDSARWTWGAGVLFGVSSLVRESFLSLAVCLACVLVVTRGWRLAGWFAIGLVVAVSPWTLRNVIVKDTPVLISTSVGHNLLVGNNPYSDGSIGPGRRIFESSANPIVPNLTDYEEHRIGTRYAVNWALSNPMAFVKKGVRGGLNMFGLDRQFFHDMQAGYFGRHFGKGMQFGLALLLLPAWPLLLATVGFGIFSAPRETRIVGVTALVWMFATGFIAFGEWRFRTSALAFLFPLAAYGVTALRAHRVTKRETVLVGGGMFVLSLFWVWEVMTRAASMLD